MAKKGIFSFLLGKGKKGSKKVKKVSKPKKVKSSNPTKKINGNIDRTIKIKEMEIARKIAVNYLHLHKNLLDKNEPKINHKGKSAVKEIKKEKKEGFIKTGIKGFDQLLKGGGIPNKTSILVEGGPGSGKTVFCLQTAYNACVNGKTVLYMSFEEPEENLLSHMRTFGWEPDKFVKNGQLNIRRFNALDIARSVEALLSEAKKELLIEVQPILVPQDINPDLVLVDSLTSIASAFSGEQSRFRIYMEQLFRYLESHEISSLLIREVPNPGHVGQSASGTEEATSFLSDGIIVFYNVVYPNGKRNRAVEILKLRGTQFERKIVEAEIINGKGLVIYPNKTIKGDYKLT